MKIPTHYICDICGEDIERTHTILRGTYGRTQILNQMTVFKGAITDKRELHICEICWEELQQAVKEKIKTYGDTNTEH